MIKKELKKRQSEWDIFHNWEKSKFVYDKPINETINQIGELVDLYLEKNKPEKWDSSHVQGIVELHKKLSCLGRVA